MQKKQFLNFLFHCLLSNIHIYYPYIIEMGSCVSPGTLAAEKIKSIKASKFSTTQLTLLQLMYENLAKRCRNQLVTRETFDVFFHANGLIGQILFQRFDAHKKGTISLQEFILAFELMTKGTLRQRADVLFSIYDVGNSGGIKYDGLLKILFSYAPEQLNKMFSQQKFLKYIGQMQLNYYFGAEHRVIQEKMILQQQSETQENHKNSKNNKVGYVTGSIVLGKLETQLNQNSKSKVTPLELKNSLLKQSKDNKSPLRLTKNDSRFKANRTVSTVINQPKFGKRNLKVKSNIASLTKKYANFLFSNYNIDKQTDVFSRQNFFQLLQQHTGLFNVYLSGFHMYVWQAQHGQPDFKSMISWVQGQAEEVYQQKQQSVYLKYVRTTIFVLSHKRSKMPNQIINLQGLTVDILTSRQGKPAHGITFKHRDGLYPAKQYYFHKKEDHSQWVKLLSQFMSSSLQDTYIKLQRIGGGNYSNVFRGKNKKTGQEVAIKVMETFKLSVAEKQVLKREVGMLKQCHHPNIIKFYQEYKTKTDLCIVTEICTEGDLFQYTKRHGFLQEYEAAIIFKQLVDAILYLNNQLGIVHRDLKPQNVLVKMTEDKKKVKRIKLIDFGFGVFKDKIKDLPLKQKFAGTPGFIAPQIYMQEEYDQKIDTFSLGIILYFMLSGQFPFHSTFLQEIEALTKTCSVSLVNNHWANISDEAKDLILKILTLKDKRISTKQVSQHAWLQNLQNLKVYNGRNVRKGKTLIVQN